MISTLYYVCMINTLYYLFLNDILGDKIIPDFWRDWLSGSFKYKYNFKKNYLFIFPKFKKWLQSFAVIAVYTLNSLHFLNLLTAAAN